MSYYGNESPASSAGEQATDEQSTVEQASGDPLEQAETLDDGVGDALLAKIRDR